MVKYEDEFCKLIMRLIAERQIVIDKGVLPPSRQELIDQIPVSQICRLQWPLRRDLDRLTD